MTFRALTERLATGPGAIYWHVANRGELLVAATDAVVAAGLAIEPAASPDSSPQDRIRAVAVGLFDAIEAHPWVAAQLSVSSYQSTTPRILQSVGRQVRALGVPPARQFTVASVLGEHIPGAAGQNTARATTLGPDLDRPPFLDAVSKAWAELDPTTTRSSGASPIGCARTMTARSSSRPSPSFSRASPPSSSDVRDCARSRR